MSPTSYLAAPPRDVGGGGRIRTFEGVCQQIYSLPQLATLVPLHVIQLYISAKASAIVTPGRCPVNLVLLVFLWSQRWELNPQPPAYKAGALPIELHWPTEQNAVAIYGSSDHYNTRYALGQY